MAWTIIPGAGGGPGFNPYGQDYPFTNPPDELRGILVDLYLNHEVYTAKPPLWVGFFYRFNLFMQSPGPPSGTRPWISIFDADFNLVFNSEDSGITYSGRPFGNKLYVHEWISDTAVCRIVQHSAFNSEDDVFEYPDAVLPEPDEGQLDARTWELRPKYVKKILVDTSEFNSDVVFANGWNTEFILGEDKTFGLRAGREITISAEPGSGLGRFPECDDAPPPIYTINGVAPDDKGNLILAADKCLLVHKPETLATLQLGNVCHECAPCSDYENVYKAYIKVWEIYKALGERVNGLVDLYNQVRQKWLEQKACRASNTVRIDILSNILKSADVDITLCNNDPNECLTDVQLDFSTAILNDASYTIDIIDGTVYTFRPEKAKYEQDVALYLGATSLGPDTWRMSWDMIPPGSRAGLRFRLRPKVGGSFTDAYDGLKTQVCAKVTSYVGKDGVFPDTAVCETMTWVEPK